MNSDNTKNNYAENKYKYKLENGITLCEKCHFLVHNKIEAEVSE